VMEDAEYRFEVARAIGSARTELYWPLTYH
jgi:hypothetical protein